MRERRIGSRKAFLAGQKPGNIVEQGQRHRQATMVKMKWLERLFLGFIAHRGEVLPSMGRDCNQETTTLVLQAFIREKSLKTVL